MKNKENKFEYILSRTLKGSIGLALTTYVMFGPYILFLATKNVNVFFLYFPNFVFLGYLLGDI